MPNLHRVAKLALPAVAIAAIINVPKFFETELVWQKEEEEVRRESLL